MLRATSTRMSLHRVSLLRLCVLLLARISICSSKLLAEMPNQQRNESPETLTLNLHRNSPWPTSHVRIFLSPTFTFHEKAIMRAAFVEFRQKTCVQFNEELWVPWYHWKRWEGPHIIVRPSEEINVMAESKMDDNLNRTLVYMSRKSLNLANKDLARGIVLGELTRILGLEPEYLRPDVARYIIFASSTLLQIAKAKIQRSTFNQIQWPFDPTSVNMAEPNESQNFRYKLNILCGNVKASDIAKGKKTGRLTFWDVVKIDSIYCFDRVPIQADSIAGPCERTSRPRTALLRSRRFRNRAAHRMQKVARRSR